MPFVVVRCQTTVHICLTLASTLSMADVGATIVNRVRK